MSLNFILLQGITYQNSISKRYGLKDYGIEYPTRIFILLQAVHVNHFLMKLGLFCQLEVYNIFNINTYCIKQV